MVGGGFHLGKHLEEAGEHVGGDSLAGIPKADGEVLAFGFRGEPDAAADCGILRGIGEEVAEDLFEPSRVGLNHQGLPWKGDDQFMLAFFDQGRHGIDRSADDEREVHDFLPKQNLAL